jgi:hypothetical protein
MNADVHPSVKGILDRQALRFGEVGGKDGLE